MSTASLSVNSLSVNLAGLVLGSPFSSGLCSLLDTGIQNHWSTVGVLKLWEWVKKKDVG